MQDKELMSLLQTSEPYLEDNGFTDMLMEALPEEQSNIAMSNPWVARLPFVAMILAMAVVSAVTPIGEMFTQLVFNPMQWQGWWMLALMIVVLIGVSLVWVNEERSMEIEPKFR